MRKLAAVPVPAEDEAGANGEGAGNGPAGLDAYGNPLALASPLDNARQLAKQDPHAVASVVKNWAAGGAS